MPRYPYHYAHYQSPLSDGTPRERQQVVHPLVIGSRKAHKAFAALTGEDRQKAVHQMQKIGEMVSTIAAQMGIKPPAIVLGMDERDPMSNWFAGATSDRKAKPTYRIYIDTRYIQDLGMLDSLGQARDALCCNDAMLQGIIGHELAHIQTRRLGYEAVPRLEEGYQSVYNLTQQITEPVFISNQEEREAALKYNHATEHLMDVTADHHTGNGRAFMASFGLRERDKRESILRDGHTPFELAEIKKKGTTPPELTYQERCEKRAARTARFNEAIDTHPSYTSRCEMVRQSAADHRGAIRQLEKEIRSAENTLYLLGR